MEEVFVQLAIILFTAFIVSYIVRAFNQPVIIGYIIAGIIISPFIINAGITQEINGVLSKFGIAFLLFTVGLHLNPKVIKEVGKSSLFIGLAQIILTFLIGFFISIKVLRFELIPSLYIGVALTFSSTIIVMKLLSDRKQLDSLFGKISIGILIVQDLVAVVFLMVITSISDGTSLTSFAVKGLLGGASLIILLFLIGLFIFPSLLKSIAKSQEILFLFSICWCFLIATLFNYIGFSIEIGALIAGVVLSISPYNTEISSKIKPLRDFFLIIFFIILGLNMQIHDIKLILMDALIFSVIVFLFKPLILITFSALFNYSKRTNFLVGTTLAQISEFSLIILALGVSLGQINPELLSAMTLTGIITITFSTYVIMYSKEIYPKIAKFLSIFERKNAIIEKKMKKQYDAILFGYNRIGFGILTSLKRIRKKYLVVDFNPEIIANLTRVRMPCIYGDAYDQEFLEDLPLDKIQIAVSTIPDFETNVLLVETIRLVNSDAKIIVRAHQIQEALELYKKGASYVLTPHFLGGEYVSKMIKEIRTNEKGYEKEKEKHIKMLKQRIERGHEHPEVTAN